MPLYTAEPRDNLKEHQKSYQGKKMKMLLNQLMLCEFLIQMALVLDFAYGYVLAGHVIWHGHFLISLSPSKAPLKATTSALVVLHTL